MPVLLAVAVRDGKSAVEHATRACQLTQFRVPSYVSTLTAAYAEAGDYKRAAELAEKINDERLKVTGRGSRCGSDGLKSRIETPMSIRPRMYVLCGDHSLAIAQN